MQPMSNKRFRILSKVEERKTNIFAYDQKSKKQLSFGECIKRSKQIVSGILLLPGYNIRFSQVFVMILK